MIKHLLDKKLCYLGISFIFKLLEQIKMFQLRHFILEVDEWIFIMFGGSDRTLCCDKYYFIISYDNRITVYLLCCKTYGTCHVIIKMDFINFVNVRMFHADKIYYRDLTIGCQEIGTYAMKLLHQSL